MPLLSFQGRFADSVREGSKRQTIRAHRRDGRDPEAGDRLHFYCGPYRPGERVKLGEATCTETQGIKISRRSFRAPWWMIRVRVELEGPRGGWRELSGDEIAAFAIADGFAGGHEFATYFLNQHGRTFLGLVVKWDRIERA